MCSVIGLSPGAIAGIVIGAYIMILFVASRKVVNLLLFSAANVNHIYRAYFT